MSFVVLVGNLLLLSAYLGGVWCTKLWCFILFLYFVESVRDRHIILPSAYSVRLPRRRKS